MRKNSNTQQNYSYLSDLSKLNCVNNISGICNKLSEVNMIKKLKEPRSSLIITKRKDSISSVSGVFSGTKKTTTNSLSNNHNYQNNASLSGNKVKNSSIGGSKKVVLNKYD
jgi:hypothetical protein